MEDDGPDMIIIKDETFDDGPGKSKSQVTSRSSDKGAVNDSRINRILPVYILQCLHLTLLTHRPWVLGSGTGRGSEK